MTAIAMTDEMIRGRMAKVGSIDPATRSKCVEIIKAAAAAGHDIWYTWGCGGGEHSCPPGLALDLMVKNEAAGDWVRNYIWTNRARLRLRHVIWEQHITSTVTSPGVRRAMADRGSTTENHYDHNHVRFLPGPYVAPTTSGNASSIPDVFKNDPTLERGDTGSGVKALQETLKRAYPSYAGKLAVDSSFGPALQKAVMEFQRRAGLVVDGKVGPATRAALAKIPKPAPPKPPAPKPPAPKPASTPTLRRGSTGSRVLLLQKGLRRVFPAYAGTLAADGSFGPGTEKDVKEFQRRSGLTADGVVGAKTRAKLATHGIVF